MRGQACPSAPLSCPARSHLTPDGQLLQEGREPRPGAAPILASVAPMVPKISGTQLNKLGDRLASPEPISDADYALLGQVAEGYQAVLDKVEEKLQGLGYQATTRVKTTGTLVDKLRRSPHLKLKTIHDVAGARIVIDGGRWEQDQVVERIMEAFANCPKAPELIDRRESRATATGPSTSWCMRTARPSRFRCGPNFRTYGPRSLRSSVTPGAAVSDTASLPSSRTSQLSSRHVIA